MGLIGKSKEIGIYEDTEFEELSRFLKTLTEIAKMAMAQLRNELGVMAEEVLDRAREGLGYGYGRIFHGISLEGDLSLDTNKILKNISVNYPSPSDRLIFIDGFYGLISIMLQEMRYLLGTPITTVVNAKIAKVKEDIASFYTDSTARSKVLDVLDKLVAQFSE
jgi:hypothetical protein